MNNKETITFIIDAIEQVRGNDLARAKKSFERFTPEQMEENYGQLDCTRSECLYIYERHNQKCDEAVAFMKNLNNE
jgi:hypothetical protein